MKLFSEIREKNTIADLSPQYQKFAEWLRIECVDCRDLQRIFRLD